MATDRDYMKEALELKMKLIQDAIEWQQPFLDLLNRSFLGDKEKVEYGDLQITRDGKRFRLSLITKTANPNNSKDVGVKEKFLCFDMYRLSLTQKEALQALAEFKTLGEFVSFSLVECVSISD